MSKEGEFLGHPKGLYVLSTTELWERFSFYSMRGILTLYMVNVVLMQEAEGRRLANEIYGAYLGFVYASTFIGGMLADRLLGQRRAIYIGGTLMALAQFLLATHAWLVKTGTPAAELNAMFFLGLGMLSCGNGFFKPNISTVVGTLYQPGDPRRDGAFTIFYMGINVGAAMAAFSGQIAQSRGWHLGFLLAGCGMVLGQVIFALGRSQIIGKGMPPPGTTLTSKGRFLVPNIVPLVIGVAIFIPVAGYLISRPGWVQDLALWLAVPIVFYLMWEAGRSGLTEGYGAGSLGGIAVIGFLAAAASLTAHKFSLPQWAWIIPLPFVALCLALLVRAAARSAEGGRMVVLTVLCTFSMMFWGFFELAGSAVTLFTDDHVNRMIGSFELQASFINQFFNPFFIILLGIPFSWLWVWLDKRRMEPSSPVKFSLGLLQIGLGFFMLYIGAKQAADGNKCSMIWILLSYMIQTTGELCLSPVGLSTVTKLAPTRLVGMFMGVWFLSAALANVFGGIVGGKTEEHGFDKVFFWIAATAGVSAVVLFVLAPFLKRMMHGVK